MQESISTLGDNVNSKYYTMEFTANLNTCGDSLWSRKVTQVPITGIGFVHVVGLPFGDLRVYFDTSV